jgi:hypothetical protein
MKRINICIAVVLSAMSAVLAQGSSNFDVSFSSGIAIPTSPMTFANYWKMEYGGAVGAAVTLSPSVSLTGTFEYYQFDLDNDGISEGFDTKYMRDIWVFSNVSLNASAASSSISTLALNLRIAPSELTGMLIPYVVAGGGMMWYSMSEISLPTNSTIDIAGSPVTISARRRITGGNETVPFVQFGMGMDVQWLDPVIIFIEARYTRGLSEGLGTSYLPLAAGVKYRL